MRPKLSHGRSRSLSDPLARALLPPEDESPTERDSRLEREERARRVNDAIDEQIRRDKAELKRQKNMIKVLLLGQSESGKSTTLKQFQLLHTPAAFHQERIAWRAVIYLNLIRSVRRILDALVPPDSVPPYYPDMPVHDSDDIDSFLHIDGPSMSTSRLPKFERYIKRLSPLLILEQRLIRQLAFPDEEDDPDPAEISPTSSLPPHIGIPIPASQTKGGELALRPTSNWKKSFSFLSGNESKSAHTGELRGWWEDPRDPVHVLHACASGEYGMRALWRDSDVRGTLARRRVRMEESAGFYLNDIDRITALRYIPTDDDVLRARLKTLGVVEHSFMVKGGGAHSNTSVEWRIYDVGGARQQRQAWAPFFQDVNAIIFLAPISAFDQTLAEDPRVNRLEDSMLLWRSVISNKLLKDTNIVLFLNKCDLLKAKLDAGVSLAYHMPSYRDRPNDYESVSKYFRNKFAALHYSHSPNQQRELYIHLTSVTDKLKTSIIIASVRDLILKQNLQYSRLL
ncbi:G-alpha-domain-containing protein [Fomitiporia mediterranea MF3/22]|uniref:G-alpha-domain-containing protein n=1 Tax=Fomitiporia mediterranea (strain MF3/22) TaxID=694068 RepID=UPI00044099FA|nr:G-alpha-domain-containing protein [Fomitiporia mediterranea MF3/22]EJD04660.1 G-alpha-domain-containing protein [Fomitiporia mediterranea MF3/22]